MSTNWKSPKLWARFTRLNSKCRCFETLTAKKTKHIEEKIQIGQNVFIFLSTASLHGLRPFSTANHHAYYCTDNVCKSRCVEFASGGMHLLKYVCWSTSVDLRASNCVCWIAHVKLWWLYDISQCLQRLSARHRVFKKRERTYWELPNSRHKYLPESFYNKEI